MEIMMCPYFRAKNVFDPRKASLYPLTFNASPEEIPSGACCQKHMKTTCVYYSPLLWLSTATRHPIPYSLFSQRGFLRQNGGECDYEGVLFNLLARRPDFGPCWKAKEEEEEGIILRSIVPSPPCSHLLKRLSKYEPFTKHSLLSLLCSFLFALKIYQDVKQCFSIKPIPYRTLLLLRPSHEREDPPLFSSSSFSLPPSPDKNPPSPPRPPFRPPPPAAEPRRARTNNTEEVSFSRSAMPLPQVKIGAIKYTKMWITLPPISYRI